MRLEKYLNEEESDYVSQIIDNVDKSYLNTVLKNGWLYRGTEDTSDFVMKTVRKNRTPMTTPKLVQKTLDELFFNKFGWNPRSQSAFISGDKGQAEGYGEAYLFFPIGEYRFVWSKDVRDLFDEVDLLFHMFFAKIDGKGYSSVKDSQEFADYVKSKFNVNVYKDKFLAK